jgi:uncharacterized protein (UPF0332 family)
MSPEVGALLRKARDSLTAAEILRREGYLDFAAPRAYYAMFYAAQAMLLQRDLSFSKHSAVIAAFGREFAKTGAIDSKYHRYLIDAQDFRNLGDYDIGASVTPEQVDAIFMWTREFLIMAEEHLGAN